MKYKALISSVLTAALVFSSLMISSSAADTTDTITGEVSRSSSEITLSDGTKTGVTHTEIYLNGYYGNNRVINIAEADLSNQNLTMEVINCGSYMVSTRRLTTAVADYNSSHDGETVVAAVNGDLYMTSVHSGSSVTKKVLGVPRGVLIVDGEIWASAQIDQENYGATNDEYMTPAGRKPAFGITYLNQPVIGTPLITTELSIDGTIVTADGINRLPAMDSIIAYNYRCYSTNYALNDSYEVELEMTSGSAFKAGGTISGRIVRIYESGSTERPTLSANTVVLTARGSRIDELKAACAVGKTVTLSTELVDYYGRTELWQNVKDAVGGHMRVLRDGDGEPFASSTYYPTTLIGYKDDGTVALVTVTSALDNSRAALKISQSYELCLELGYNTVFYLDGGGSTTFVTLEEGTYSVRNKCSDGSQRYIMGGIGFVWNDTPVCMRQGSLYHIDIKHDISDVSPVHMDGALINQTKETENDVIVSYDEKENYVSITTSADTSDPFISLNYSRLKEIDVQDYPHVIIKARTSLDTQSTFSLYYACGEYTDSSTERINSRTVSPSDDWQYVSFNFSRDELWSGALNSLRLDIFNEAVPKGATMDIASITLCKDATDISNIRKGIIPEGSVIYKDIVDSLKPTPDFIIGDIKEDGKINASDSLFMKSSMKGAMKLSDSQFCAADVNGNGKVNAVDSIFLRQRIAEGKWKY